MTAPPRYRCRACGRTYGVDEMVWRCACAGLLDLDPALDERPVEEVRGALRGGAPAGAPCSMWRYEPALPQLPGGWNWRHATLGEGMTPLVDVAPGALAKLDFLMPTLSYKDRGAVLLVGAASAARARRLVADSSGNAGVSIAAYAARAGLAARVFVPATTSSKKLAQLRAFGAEAVRVAGDRAAAAQAAQEEAGAAGTFYASHVYNPLFHHGTKTLVYELLEQLGGRLPEVLVLPAGNGTLLLGAAIALGELRAAGLIARSPRLVAVQAAACAPLAAAWRRRQRAAAGTAGRSGSGAGPVGGAEPVSGGAPVSGGGVQETTLAEGIAIARPPRLAQMLEAVESSGGAVVTVGEEEIVAARAGLAGQGIDVEPTAATAFAALAHVAGRGDVASSGDVPATDDVAGTGARGDVVIVLTGAGLKATATDAG